KAELLVEKGQLLEDRLGNVTGAAECYEKAAEAWPQSLAAWMALEKVHAPGRDEARMTNIARGLADATAEPARKVALLVDLARRQQGAGDVASAQTTLREALAVGSDVDRVLDELERLAERAGALAELERVLDERAARLELGLRERPVEEQGAEVELL